MRIAKAFDNSTLSLPPDSYVYNIKPLGGNLVASCSDDSLRIVNADLKLAGQITKTHDGITSVATNPSTASIVLTSGRDGFFRAWDLRTGQRTFESSNVSGAAVLSLAVSPLSNYIAVGAELMNHQAAVTVWDPRSLQQPVVNYVESHNDDVTDIVWHPTDPSFLITGSTDGLLNLYDTLVVDEDEAVVRTWNHGSVNHAAWPEGAGIENGHETIYAASHDEQLAVYRIPLDNTNAGTRYKVVEDEDAENEALDMGDVRPKFDCEYVVDFVPSGGHMIAAVGKHTESRVDLIDLNESLRANGIDDESTIRIPGAHGEELVRTIHIDSMSNSIYTGGEDGKIKSWAVGT